MKKSTFYGLATFCGLGSLFFALVVWLAFFDTGGGGSKSMRVEQDFLVIHAALKMYAANAGQPPTTAQGLDALVNKPKTGPQPRRWTLFMTKLPLDPWQAPYRFTLLAPKEREWRWELRSAGSDRVFGNRDDLAAEEEYGDYLTLEDGSVESRPSY
jgi:type II secretion system protein G